MGMASGGNQSNNFFAIMQTVVAFSWNLGSGPKCSRVQCQSLSACIRQSEAPLLAKGSHGFLLHMLHVTVS